MPLVLIIFDVNSGKCHSHYSHPPDLGADGEIKKSMSNKLKEKRKTDPLAGLAKPANVLAAEKRGSVDSKADLEVSVVIRGGWCFL
jgi:hypothetical protein